MDRFTGRLLMPWLRFTLLPEGTAAQLAAAPAPICYVMERQRTVDAVILQRACTRARLPRPGKILLPAGLRDNRSLLALSRSVGAWSARVDRRPPPQLVEMLRRLQEDPALDVTLVPVAVYWGRAPQRERSWLDLVLSDDWAIASRLRRLLTVIFNGRSTLLQIGHGVSLRAMMGGDLPNNQTARRISRQLQAEFSKARAAHIGPDLSHRRTIMAQVLRTRAVRAVVAQEVRERKIPRRKGLETAREIFEEIAANYSHAFVQICERLFTRLWTRVYDGIEFGHAGTLREVAAGNEIIYVPCHRSHIDYLLLSYAIYKQGFAIPHIAAGINLNIPVVGRFLRKGGAFFIRRSFRGNALYTVVFMRYLAAIMARGHPVEYFIEGGRSRTGRLLQPKTGMISMTIRSFLREPVRPVVFVPVYFGYERVMEAESYVGELSGKPKEKETFLGLLASLRRLRERFGRVHVNLGEPIHLAELLDAQASDWREHIAESEDPGRAPWVGATVDAAAQAIMRNINAAAAVTPINLLAITLLATDLKVLREADLLRQLDLYLKLLHSLPYSPRVTVTSLRPADIIAYGESLQAVVRGTSQDGTQGGVVRLEEAHAPLMNYYRNNVLHLFAMPSLIACCFISNATLRAEDIQRLAWRIYPYIGAELFLWWSEEDLPGIVGETLSVLASLGLLAGDTEAGVWRRPPPATSEAMQLSLLARPTIQIIERYYLPIALLLQAGSGQLTQSALQKRCEQAARQMVTLYGFYAPEFFDRTLFEGFLSLLRRRGVLRADSDGRLLFDEVLQRIADDAQLVLSEALRHSILQVMHG
jgi:glycerol-3-phosphate O-acyltransferase